MIRVVADEKLLEQIRQAGTPVQLCDAAGNDVAIAWPGLSKYAGIEEMPLPTQEELRRILAEKPRYNIDEVLAVLEKSK
jgi:hypothetical protein